MDRRVIVMIFVFSFFSIFISASIIGVVDYGVDLCHPDIANYCYGDDASYVGWKTEDDGIDIDWVNEEYPNLVHGTEMAGAILSQNTNVRIKSIYANFMPDDQDPSPGYPRTTVDISKFSDVNILVMAFGFYYYDKVSLEREHDTFDKIDFRDTMAKLYRNNVLLIAATGNGDEEGFHQPASFENMLRVGSSFENKRWWGSEYRVSDDGGVYRFTYGSNYGSDLDLCAPVGENLCTCVKWESAYDINDESAHIHLQKKSTGFGATSAASAYVAAYAAKFWDAHPQFDNSDIENIFKYTADDIGLTGYDIETGYGDINYSNAEKFYNENFFFKKNTSNVLWTVGSGTEQNMELRNFYNLGVDNGFYNVKIYTCYSSIDLSDEFGIPITTVWGARAPYAYDLSINSEGLSDATPNCYMPFNEVTSYGNSTVNMRTYIYHVLSDNDGNPIDKWIPRKPVEGKIQMTNGYTVAIKRQSPSNLNLSGKMTVISTKGTAPEYKYTLNTSLTYGTFKVLNYQYEFSKDGLNWVILSKSTNTTYSGTTTTNPAYFRVHIDDSGWTSAAGYYTNTIRMSAPLNTDPIVAYVDNDDATAYSNAKKMVIDTSGVVHVVFTKGDSVFYGTSKDDGEHWSKFTKIGKGKNPAISLLNRRVPTLCYIDDNKIMFSKNEDGNWSGNMIFQGAGDAAIEYLAYENNDCSGLSVIGWVDNASSGSNVNYGIIDPNNGGSIINTRVIDNGGEDEFRCPSISIRNDGNVSMAWSRNGTVYLTDTQGVAREVVSNEEGYSAHPIVSNYGDKTTVVWQETNAEGKSRIVMKSRIRDTWLPREIITDYAGDNAEYPHVAGGDKCVFQRKNNGTDYDVEYAGSFKNGWLKEYQNISYQSGGNSYFPSAEVTQIWPKTKLYVLWTENNGGNGTKGSVVPYTAVKIATVEDVDPMEMEYCDCGTENGNYYLVSQAETLQYTNLPEHTIDYSTDRLRYKFTCLDRTKHYLVKVKAYHEFEESVEQKINFDNTSSSLMKIKPNKITESEKWLPVSTYKDGEVVIEINKHAGSDKVVCSEILLYEYEKGHGEENTKEIGRISTDKRVTVAVSDRILVDNNSINIELYSEGIEDAEVEVYNTIGQKICKIFNGKLSKGNNRIVWNKETEDGKVVKTGIYFIRVKTSGQTTNKKLIIL